MWFNKKKLKVNYIAFESKVMKYKYLLKSFEESASETTCWLYYFESTRDEMRKLCEATDVPCSLKSPGELLSKGINLVDARSVKLSSLGSYDEILLLETHPMASVNSEVQEQAKEKELKELNYLTSLDAPIMELFGGDRLKRIMSQLGLKEAEPIEHSMVSKSIEKSMERIENSTTKHNDVRESPEAWLIANPINV
jgi:hypothetical protein